MGKTNALNDDDLREFVELQAHLPTRRKIVVDRCDRRRSGRSRFVGEKSEQWREEALRDPQDIIAEIVALDLESAGHPRKYPEDAVRCRMGNRQARRRLRIRER